MTTASKPKWDNDAGTVAGELRAALSAMKDEGTGIDGGGGDNSYDLWVTIGGYEYVITVRKTEAVKRRAREAER